MTQSALAGWPQKLNYWCAFIYAPLHKRKRIEMKKLFTPSPLSVSAHANTLTGLIPDLYAGLNVVSRELVGFIPSVTRNVSAERAAVGEAVTWGIAPAMAAADIAPAMTIPEPTDRTIANDNIKITKARAVEFGFIGEEQKGLNNGPGYLNMQADMFAQALRTLTNEVETDLAVEAALNSSRAYGTAGTTPFGTNTGETAQIKKMLDDNGCPASERALILDTTAGAALRTLTNLTKVNEAGTAMTLRDGELLNLNNFSIKESAAVTSRAVGTASSATTNTAGYAVGSTTITLASAGTGTLVAGDVITFAGDTNKYVVVSGDTDVSNGGTFTIAAPGLRVALAASAIAITVVARGVRNIGFTKSALHLAARAPALPKEGDLAIDRFMLTDPRSGMVYEVSVYAGYRKVRYEVALAWGVKAAKREHIVTLLG